MVEASKNIGTELWHTKERCFTAYERAAEDSKWVVVPLWKPQFFHLQFTIRELKELQGSLGTVDRAVFTQAQLVQLGKLHFSNEIIVLMKARPPATPSKSQSLNHSITQPIKSLCPSFV